MSSVRDPDLIELLQSQEISRLMEKIKKIQNI